MYLKLIESKNTEQLTVFDKSFINSTLTLDLESILYIVHF